MRYYVVGEPIGPRVSMRQSADIEAADPEAAAVAFFKLHPELDEVRVYADFNSAWDTLTRSPAKPLLTWHRTASGGVIS